MDVLYLTSVADIFRVSLTRRDKYELRSPEPCAKSAIRFSNKLQAGTAWIKSASLVKGDPCSLCSKIGEVMPPRP